MSFVKIPALCFILFLSFNAGFVFAQQEEKLTITTYYPSPYGIYQNLRMNPSTNPGDCTGASAPLGKMYFDSAMNALFVCSRVGATYGYQLVPGGGGAWGTNANYLYVMNTTLNVGVGTVTPSGRLQVVGGASELGQRGIAGTAYNNDTHMVRFWGNSGCASNSLHNGGRIFGMMRGCDWNQAELHLEAGNNWDGWVNNQLVLKGNGTIGVGTVAPSATLHVAGDSFLADGFDHTMLTATRLNNNTGLRAGLYQNSGDGLRNAANSAVALPSWWHVINLHHQHNNGYNAQIAVPLSSALTDMYFRTSGGGAWTEWRKVISENTSGNAGIGTTAPSQRLHVAGNIMGAAPDGTNTWRLDRLAGADPWVRLYQGNTGTYNNFAVGPFWANGAQRFDIAEVTPVKESDALEAGDVVCIDPGASVRLRRCQNAYDKFTAGIVSDYDTASMVIGGDTPPESARSVKDKMPIALAGRVLCKVTDENGAVFTGELIVSSSRPGYAMRADRDKALPGTVIGKAMETLEGKEGKIMVWVVH